MPVSKINILPEILSNKIAAGEVVERPASVVKELVENSLDAGSDRITIDIEKGGRTLIRVSDNGSGMSHDDALLCIERYATSKIRSEADLFTINTLGFRGEALPSIASVSRFALVSRDSRSSEGTEIFIEGGQLRDVKVVGAPKGTMISVAGLFFNTPARRKFLKTVQTEMGHIADTVARQALSRADVYFRLRHNDRDLKRWPATTDPRDRIVDVCGRDVLPHLAPVTFKAEGIVISGWVAASRITRRTSAGIFLFVNNRFVRDRVVQHALFAGYDGRLMKGRFPVAILFLKVPFEAVDVNVHPTKSEVRFTHSRMVHDAVRAAIHNALTSFDIHDLSDRTPQTDTPMRSQVSEALPSFGNPAVWGGEADPKGHFTGPETRRKGNGKHWRSAGGEWRQSGSKGGRSFLSRMEAPDLFPADGEGNRLDQEKKGRADPQRPLWHSEGFQRLRVIGQAHNTYIVCESPDGLILIDQHAAHERVLFETLGREAAHKNASQKLLVPETLDIGYHEAAILERMVPLLTELGFDIAPFGGTTFVISAVPNHLAGQEVSPLIRELLEDTAETGSEQNPGKMREKYLTIIACHAAIRARQGLSEREMHALLVQLDQCQNPFHCPHGRPTWVRWRFEELEKQFGRKA